MIVFRRGNRNVDVSMLYNNQQLEVVNNCVYLGVALFSNGNCNRTQLRACELGSRALFVEQCSCITCVKLRSRNMGFSSS
jgi:hypothetical protein